MKFICTLLMGLILTSVITITSCGGTDNSKIYNFNYTTYTNWSADYMVDYPADWGITELEQYILICPLSEFSMFAEINTPAQDTPVDSWLTAKPSWCEEFQIQSSSNNCTLFTGYYGWTPIYGRIYLKKIHDEYCVLTLLYSIDLHDCSASQMPDELNLILNSFRPVEKNFLFIPPYEPLGPPPVEVTIDQLYSEYMADEIAAEAKYKGKRLWFTGVKVEELGSFIRNPDPQISKGEGFVFKRDLENVDIYIMNGSVKFRPRDTWVIYTIRVGCKVDIVGTVFGLISDVLIIEDCWIGITEGGTSPVY